MARSFAAIKITIGLRPNGEADHPNFNLLPIVQAFYNLSAPPTDKEKREGKDWSYYLKNFGEGWAYDKSSRHEDDNDSDPDGTPIGNQYGVLLIPEQFAIEALAEFPTTIVRLTETELQDYWDNRAYAHLSVNKRQEAILSQYDRERSLLERAESNATGQDKVNLRSRLDALDVEILKAIDPDDVTPGVRKNHKKTWASWKGKNSITILEA